MLTKRLVVYVVLLWSVNVYAGFYAQPGINGYIGDDRQHAGPNDPNAIVNPIFKGWATGYENYLPAPGVETEWATPEETLGPATGDVGDVASLGDLDQGQIDACIRPGEITLTFGLSVEPDDEPIKDANGLDFVVFENALFLSYSVQAGLASGDIFAELGYVEVSTDGDPNHFAGFPNVSLTPELVWAYGTIDITDVYNLAGKHPNSYSYCTGTPFDLSELANHRLVVNGTVDLDDIRYVRIVDIPGSGDFYDDPNSMVDPNTLSDYQYQHPIYDAWKTFGSGGFDLDAIGTLYEQNKPADVNLDGVVDMGDLYIFIPAWLSRIGDENWNQRCNIAHPKDYVIDIKDFAVITYQWLESEKWASP